MNEASLDVVALAVIEVVGSQVVVGLMPCEHMVEGDQHGMADGEHGATLATACGDAAKLGCQIRPLHAADNVRDFRQRAPHPGVAAACPAAEASTTTLRIARAHPRPGGEMLS